MLAVLGKSDARKIIPFITRFAVIRLGGSFYKALSEDLLPLLARGISKR